MNWLCWDLTTRQPLWVIWCHLPESGSDEREGQGRKRNRNESKETEEIKTFPSNLTCYKDSRPCPTVSQYQLDAPMSQDTRHLCLTQPSPLRNLTKTFVGKKKWTNKEKNKHEDADSLLHNTRSHTQCFYQISKLYVEWFLRNLWWKKFTQTLLRKGLQEAHKGLNRFLYWQIQYLFFFFFFFFFFFVFTTGTITFFAGKRLFPLENCLEKPLMHFSWFQKVGTIDNNVNIIMCH